MSCSTSSPTNTTSTTTNAEETNTAATNTQGTTILGNKGPVTIVSTDEGAVQAGTKTAQLALASNTGLSEALASDYENETETSATQSANLVDSVLNQGFTFLANENNTIQNIEQQNATNQSDTLGNYATTLSNIATAQDTSSQAQANAQTTTILKIGAVVILGVALLYFATRK